MKLAFDYTLLVQFGQLLVLLILLHFLVFKPVLKALGKRRETLDSLADKAGGSTLDVENLGRRYEESLKERKNPILEERNNLLKQSHTASMQVIEAARQDLAEELAKVKDGVSREVASSLEILKGQSDVLAGEIVQKIMKRGA
jgi:F-type H+-transporting ATPase subunit b